MRAGRALPPADQDVEAAALGRNLDPTIDAVDEEEALVLIFKGRFDAAPEDNPDHLLEAVREGARGAVPDEAELSNRSHDALARLRARSPLAVEHSRDRGDRDAGQAGDVIDRQRPLDSLCLGHEGLSPP